MYNVSHKILSAVTGVPRSSRLAVARGRRLGEVVEQIPIIGLPLYGALISPLALFGLLFYPFVEHILPDNGHTGEGIETSAMTWTDDVLVFHGAYDPAAFDEQYADGFDIIDERDRFTIYGGVDAFTEGWFMPSPKR